MIDDKTKMYCYEGVKHFIRSTSPDKGKKYDEGKAPIVRGFLRYFPRAIAAGALISKYGTDKYQVEYEDQNWRRVEGAQGRYLDAEGRHLLNEGIDGSYDPESGLLHAAHKLWNAAAELEKQLEEGTPLGNPNPDVEKLAEHVRKRYESTGSVL
jgi:hypothetical protein